MKKLLLILLCLPMFGFGQGFPISEKTGKVTYEGVVKVEGASASGLYVQANEWFAKSFRSANSVIQMQDKEEGKIIGKGSIEAYFKEWATVGVWNFTLSFECREGRYRYVLTDISHDKIGSKLTGSGGLIGNEKPACGTFHFSKKSWNKLKSNASKDLIKSIDGLLQYMSEANNKDDDW
jgi:hypothetical protein